MCAAVTRLIRLNGTKVAPSSPATASAETCAPLPRSSICAITSRRVRRPPRPVPAMSAVSRACSAMSRETTGERTRAMEPDGAADGGAVARGMAARAAGGSIAAAATVAEAPPSSMTAILVPIFTVSPSATRISARMPSAGAGISVSTLSVETSNRVSSAVTLSPIFLHHTVTVPSVTVSPSCGMMTSISSAPSPVRPQSTQRRMVSAMRSAEGIARSSRLSADGSGMCGVVMRSTGPSRS